MEEPITVRYAQSGDVSIAYHEIGSGPPDVILMPGFITHLETGWAFPPMRRFAERIASFSRLIRFDKRGTGMSDRVSDRALPTLEERVDDIRAVLDDVGLERAFLFGVSDGGAMAAMFAASPPDRTHGLILYGTEAHAGSMSDAEIDALAARVRHEWGSEDQARRTLRITAPSFAEDPDWIAWMMRTQRAGASPGAVVSLVRMNEDLDIRAVLPAIRVPTLVLHRTDDVNVPFAQGRLLAEHIPRARLVELTGRDHLTFAGDVDAVIDEVEEFVTGVRDPEQRNRVLATIVFTDIVESTARALELGDRRWKELLQQHHAIVRRDIERFRGQEIDTAGDGFLASFDGPARAVRFAQHVVEQLAALGVVVRAGIHTGECEVHDGKLAGVAVHVGARIASMAAPGQVLVSSTVRDLVAGSGLTFEDRGEHQLRGLPETRRLYAVTSS